MNKEKIIRVETLTTAYGRTVIHKDLDLAVYNDEILAIVGGSGAGKTTLVRNILALQTPVSGHIYFKNTEISNADEQTITEFRRQCGVLFQQGALFSTLSVLENVAYPLIEFTDLPRQSIDEIAALKIKLVGLSDSAIHKMPAELSGGMVKRAALARAIALDPSVLFLDEPTSGLDPHSAGEFDELIVELRDAMDLTVVMVTHDMDSLWRITDRVAFISEGKVIACEPIEQLVKSPAEQLREFFSGPRGRVVQHNYEQSKETECKLE